MDKKIGPYVRRSRLYTAVHWEYTIYISASIDQQIIGGIEILEEIEPCFLRGITRHIGNLLKSHTFT